MAQKEATSAINPTRGYGYINRQTDSTIALCLSHIQMLDHIETGENRKQACEGFDFMMEQRGFSARNMGSTRSTGFRRHLFGTVVREYAQCQW